MKGKLIFGTIISESFLLTGKNKL